MLAILLSLGFSLVAYASTHAQDLPLPFAKDGNAVHTAAVSNLDLRNEFVSAIASDSGQFVIGTTGGDPNTENDNDRRLLYGYPGSIGTSFSTLRIIGNGIESDYRLGVDAAPIAQPALENNRIVTVWLIDGVRVTQRLYLDLNPDTNRNDTVNIEYEIHNESGTGKQIGLRMMLDTMIGGNDGAPFFILGAGQVTQEFEWSGNSVPAFWIAYESPIFASDSLKGRGQLSDGNLTKPDRFVVSDWPDAYSSIWTYIVEPADAVTWDSAVILYYNPIDVAPGATRMIRTSYGIARSGSTQQIDLIGLEVTQGIQNWNGDVALIQDRPTYVRAHVQSTAGTVSGVSAELYGRRNGVALPGSPLKPSNTGARVNVRQTPQRLGLDDSFYFELPTSWLSGSVELEFRGLNQEIVCRDSAGDENDCKANVTFQQSPAAEVELVGVAWEEDGVVHAPSQGDFRNAIQEILSTFPVPSLTWNNSATIEPTFFPGQPDNLFEDITFFSRINGMLSIFRSLDGCLWNCNDYYLGVIVDRPAGRTSYVDGMATGIPGDVASGYVGNLTLPHEFGHLAGRKHVNCSGDEAGTDSQYPYPGGQIGGPGNSNEIYWGFDFSTRSVRDPSTGDLMSYCSKWPSRYTYEAIQAKLRQRYASVSASTGSSMLLQAGQPAILVSGFISLTQWGGRFAAIYTVPALSDASAPVPGDYAVEFRNSSGQTLASHSFVPDEPSEGSIGSFTLLLPLLEDTAQILLLRNGNTLDAIFASSHAPVISLISPNGGEVLAGEATSISWTATDQDNDELSYVVQYSSDGGATWQTLAAAWPETSYVLNLGQVAGGSLSKVRVLASDGLHTVGDQSDGTFTVALHAPHVTIETPTDQSLYVENQLIQMRGSAYDSEDGQLHNDSSYTWVSNVNGTLGSGKSLAVNSSQLSEGTHTITLIATDRDGMTATESFQIVVFRDRPALPPAWAIAPAGLLYQAVAGEANPDPQMLMLRNSGDGAVQWSVSADRSWILPSSLSGNVPVDILVGIDASSLGVGIYTGTLTFNSLSIAQPQAVPVVLEVTDRDPVEILINVAVPAIVADGSSETAIFAEIRDSAGRPVPGSVVSFSTSRGAISSQVTTNADGIAEAVLVSSVGAGLAEITAVSGNLQDTATVNFVAGAPAAIQLNLNPSTLLADGTSTAEVTALVKDVHGNPVPNVTVTFAASIGSITSASVTGAGGAAIATLRSAQQVGISQVAASTGGLSTNLTVPFVGNEFVGAVFADRNRNGVRETNEPGVPHVIVEMTLLSISAASAQPAADLVGATWRAESDASGTYRFTDLPLGTYSLAIRLPLGYVATTPTSFVINLGLGQVASPEIGVLSQLYLPSVRR